MFRLRWNRATSTTIFFRFKFYFTWHAQFKPGSKPFLTICHYNWRSETLYAKLQGYSVLIAHVTNASETKRPLRQPFFRPFGSTEIIQKDLINTFLDSRFWSPSCLVKELKFEFRSLVKQSDWAIFCEANLALSSIYALAVCAVIGKVRHMFLLLGRSVVQKFLFFHFGKWFYFFNAHSPPSSSLPQLNNLCLLVGQRMARFTMQILKETLKFLGWTWAFLRRRTWRRWERSLVESRAYLGREKFVRRRILGRRLDLSKWCFHC